MGARGPKSAFSDDEKRAAIAALAEEPAADIAARLGVVSRTIYGWREKMGQQRREDYSVNLSIRLDGTTYAALTTASLTAATRARRLVTPGEIAESIIRNYLTADDRSGRSGKL